MKLVRNVRDFLLDDDFKIIILKNKLNICNYDSIGYFDNDLIIINYRDGEVLVKGKKLVISKLLSNEILISGFINNVEMR